MTAATVPQPLTKGRERSVIPVLLLLAGLVTALVFCSTGEWPGADAADKKAESSPAPIVPHPDTKPVPGTPLRPPPADACVGEWCGRALGYASIIVDYGQRSTPLPQRGWVIAVATAMQESSLQNEASNTYPATKALPYDKIGTDHDSVGIFQQRPSQGWGTPTELMNPRIAAAKFYAKLQKVVKSWDNWQDPAKTELTDIAQAVQNSAKPGAYQKREADAKKVVDYVLQFSHTGSGTDANPWFVMAQCGDPRGASCQETPYQLVQPVVDNRAAFKKLFPGARYMGDLGDSSHMNANPPQEHTPISGSCAGKVCAGFGWVYAQDFGDGGGFNLSTFACWLLDQVRAGRYPEVMYIISTSPANKGGGCYGLFDRRYGWKQQPASDHDTHAHITYMPGSERAGSSSIIADYYHTKR